MIARRSRRASFRSAIPFCIETNYELTRVDTNKIQESYPTSIHSCSFAVKPLASAQTRFGDQLSLCFEPIRVCVARQCKSATAFGDEISAETNCVIRWFRRRGSRRGGH